MLEYWARVRAGVEPAPRPGAEAAVNKRRCAHLQAHIGDVLSGEGSTSRRTRAEDGEDAAPKVAVNDEVYVVVGRARTIPNVRSLYKKGYDASGKDDEEVANDEEFSDDEAEAAAKAAKKKPGKKRTTSGRIRETRPSPPSPMGGGGMFGMRGLPRPQPPAHYAQAGAPPAGAPPAYGAPGQGQPMMSVPVQYNAQGQPVIMMPPPARGAPPPPPPPPPPPHA